MVRFLKDIYLTGFAIIFRLSRAKKDSYRSGGAIGLITLVEWFVFIGIWGYIEMFLHRQILFSKRAVYGAFVALFFANMYFLMLRGFAVRFARDFDKLEKSRRIRLVVSCAVVVVVSVGFSIYSTITYRHFFGLHN